MGARSSSRTRATAVVADPSVQIRYRASPAFLGVEKRSDSWHLAISLERRHRYTGIEVAKNPRIAERCREIGSSPRQRARSSNG